MARVLIFGLVALSGAFTLVGCAPRTLAPIPAASERWVATPTSLAVLSQSGELDGVPGALTFGGASGRSALYLQFPNEWRQRGAPLAAFLALEPREDAANDAESVRVEAWRVRAPWRASALHTWSDKPELAPPYARSVASSSPPKQLRIDVTELLRFAAKNPELDHGVALIASGGAGAGVTFATGMDGGAAPRLEVYAR
ncbi:MAG TPA: hypothetical protein VGM44_06190 [Polyangiaceae bacterium]|jgi:hypothetical protein